MPQNKESKENALLKRHFIK